MQSNERLNHTEPPAGGSKKKKKKKSLERMLILIGSLLSSVYVGNKFKHCIKIQCLRKSQADGFIITAMTTPAFVSTTLNSH